MDIINAPVSLTMTEDDNVAYANTTYCHTVNHCTVIACETIVILFLDKFLSLVRKN